MTMDFHHSLSETGSTKNLTCFALRTTATKLPGLSDIKGVSGT